LISKSNDLYLPSLNYTVLYILKENSGVNMKNLLKIALVLLVFVAASCGSRENGQLIGALDRPSWQGINPYGMVYVPSGTLHIGPF
jgi:hypothetical protein